MACLPSCRAKGRNFFTEKSIQKLSAAPFATKWVLLLRSFVTAKAKAELMVYFG
ncbi:MAG TPA: hypothetical protein VF273_07055 [Pelobium sp.]